MSDDLRSPDEEFARVALHEHLATHVDPASLQWHPLIKDPPDYCLTIGDRRFGVEVTTLMDRVLVSGRQRPTAEITASLTRFVKDVKTTAGDTGVLHGAYAVAVDPIDELSRFGPELKGRILEYVSRTQDVDRAPRATLYSSGASRWWIEKFGSHKSYIGGIFHVSDAKWEGEMIEDTRRLLSERVSTKAKQLSLVLDPTALLLVDRYHFADDEEWAKAVPSSVDPGICALVRVRDNGTCQCLWSRAPWPMVGHHRFAG